MSNISDYAGKDTEYELKLPSIVPKSPFTSMEYRSAFAQRTNNVIDQRVLDTVGLFLNCIEDEGFRARQKLARSLASRDEYRRIKDTWATNSKGMQPSERFRFLGSFGTQAEDCFQNSDDVINRISNLWEFSAQLIRSFYELGVPIGRTSLLNVLKHVYPYEPGSLTPKKEGCPSLKWKIPSDHFKELIQYTQFVVDKNGNGYYEAESVLSGLKKYRNSSVHRLGVMSRSVGRELMRPYSDAAAREEALSIYDHKTHKQNYVQVPTPEKLTELAEDSYKHYLGGFEIIDDTMIRDLGGDPEEFAKLKQEGSEDFIQDLIRRKLI